MTNPLPLLPPLKPGGNPVLLMDNSTLDLFNYCDREGEYGFFRNLVSAADKEALNFGAGVHEGMKFRYMTAGNKPLNSIRPIYATGVESPEGIKEMGEELSETEEQIQVINNHFLAHPQPLDAFRSPSLCIECLERYNECYQNEPFEIVTNPKNGKPCVEQSVMVFLGTLDTGLILSQNLSDDMQSCKKDEIDLYYTGRIDLIIRNSEGVFIVDHKTTFQFGSSFTNAMSMSAQFLGYSWAYREIFGHLPQGYIINAIRVRRPTQAALLAEDFFRVRGSDPDFVRIPFYINEDNVNEWKENTLALVRTILYHHSQGTFPMNRTQCQRKWGACQFFEVCNCPRGVREEILNSQAFIQNEWSPLNNPKQEI